jgi:hypothetical protein
MNPADGRPVQQWSSFGAADFLLVRTRMTKTRADAFCRNQPVPHHWHAATLASILTKVR